MMPITAFAANSCTWTGLGDGTSWSDHNNWSNCGGVHPQNGDSLIFDVSSLSNPKTVNDDISNLQVGLISFTGSGLFGYTITGNAFSLSNGISDTSGSGNTILNNGLTLTASQSFDTAGLLDIDSTNGLAIGTNNLSIGGAGTVHIATAVTGSGTLTFGTVTGSIGFLDRNDPNFSGSIIVSNGRLIYNASTPTALGTGAITVDTGATLQESINATGTYTVSNPLTLGGSGNSGSGQLDVHVFSGGTSTVNYTGNVILSSNSHVSLEGANANMNGNVFGCNKTISLVAGSTGTLGGNLTGSCTQIPTLSSPVTNNTYDEIPISFTLPETPGSGTVNLTFIGPVTETLNLNVTSAGTTSFTLNPKNLLAAVTINSVSPPTNTLPDGTYAVTLSYQDIAFSPAATTTVNNVIINTTSAGVLIDSLTPANNAKNVSLQPTLTAVFNQPLTINTGNIIIHKVSDGSVVETIPVNGSDVSGGGTNTLTIALPSALTANNAYYVTIDSGALSNQTGTTYAGISSSSAWQFTTLADPANSATPDTGYGAPSDSSSRAASYIAVVSLIMLSLGLGLLRKR